MSILKVNTIQNVSGGTDVTNTGIWKKLTTTTVSSAVDNVTFTNSITDAWDTYKIYVVQFTQLRPSSDGGNDGSFGLRIQEGGSNYTGSEYKTRVANASGGSTAYGSADRFRVQINGVGNNSSGSDIYEDCHGYIYMYNFEANRRFAMQGTTVYKDNSSDTRCQRFGGDVNRQEATTGVSFYFLSGTITSGKFTLYGITQ
jgi:hypothetical protein